MFNFDLLPFYLKEIKIYHSAVTSPLSSEYNLNMLHDVA